MISDQVCDRDQNSVSYSKRPADRKVTMIGQVYMVSASLVQSCNILAGTTLGLRCLRHRNRGVVLGFDWLALNVVQFTLSTRVDFSSGWRTGHQALRKSHVL